jgi:hypothetical protein
MGRMSSSFFISKPLYSILPVHNLKKSHALEIPKDVRLRSLTLKNNPPYLSAVHRIPRLATKYPENIRESASFPSNRYITAAAAHWIAIRSTSIFARLIP